VLVEKIANCLLKLMEDFDHLYLEVFIAYLEQKGKRGWMFDF
jgi:hypothetical protein